LARIVDEKSDFVPPALRLDIEYKHCVTMDIDTRFPTKLNAIDDAPTPFRSVLVDNISSQEAIRLLVHAPLFSAAYLRLPATVLAVTDNGWLVASEAEDGTVGVQKSTFSDTLLLELASVLLASSFRIHFGRVGTSYNANVSFHTVEKALYCEAVDLILEGIHPESSSAAENDHDEAVLFASWPIRFRAEAERCRPKDQRLLAAIVWPALFSGFQRELCPAGALLVTKREIVLISEEKTSPRQHPGDISEFGGIITYFPIVRLEDIHVSHQDRFGILALRVHSRHGAEKLEILIPPDYEQAISTVIDQVVRSI
jgi:hypothetical protein